MYREISNQINNVKQNQIVNLEVLYKDFSKNKINEIANELLKKEYLIIKDNNYIKNYDENLSIEKIKISKTGTFAFIDLEEESLFIKVNNFNTAMNGDIVLVKKILNATEENRAIGKVVDVLLRKEQKFVGVLKEITLKTNKKLLIYENLADINIKFILDRSRLKGAKIGDVVQVYPYKYDGQKVNVRIKKIIGQHNDNKIDILSTLYKHDVKMSFEENTKNQAQKIDDVIDNKDIKNRIDLRNKLTLTIDGADAKDLDDAITVEATDKGNKLYVSIADVSYYVTEGSPLDKEALERGTSTYIVDRVVPMLPEKLSNGICSLNQGVDRYALTCEIEFDNQGNRISKKVYPSVINVNHRLTYSEVNSIILDDDKKNIEKYNDIVVDLHNMHKLSKQLNVIRKQRGSIDFEFVESKVILDDKGKAIDIIKREIRDAEKLIEEFMLAANEAVAKIIYDMDLPFLYRIHDKPKKDSLQALILLLKNMIGYEFNGDLENIKPKDIQKINDFIKQTSEYKALAPMILRSMDKAIYHQKEIGHFGLGADFYTHFTSPIRRYPDLIVHRLLRVYLFEKDTSEETINHYKKILSSIGEQCSDLERKAIDVEYDVEKIKKAEYMKQFIGQEFKGSISSVTKFGFFVNIDDKVEGLVHVSNLTNDHYEYNEELLKLVGEKNSFSLGDQVDVIVTNVTEKSDIDLEVVGIPSAPKKRRR